MQVWEIFAGWGLETDRPFAAFGRRRRRRPLEVRPVALMAQSGLGDLLDRGVITSLMAHITIAAKATGAFSGKSVCMTGFRDATMVTAIESQGGTVKSSVSKGLDILVLKDPQSTSGKAEKARKYGTKLVGIDDMWNRLGGKP